MYEISKAYPLGKFQWIFIRTTKGVCLSQSPLSSAKFKLLLKKIDQRKGS